VFYLSHCTIVVATYRTVGTRTQANFWCTGLRRYHLCRLYILYKKL